MHLYVIWRMHDSFTILFCHRRFQCVYVYCIDDIPFKYCSRLLILFFSVSPHLLADSTWLQSGDKRGRKLPILLTKEAKYGIDVLVEKRAEVGIHRDNPYVFATAGGGGLGHLRPWECLRKVAKNEELALLKPEAVTSTKLRKYVATVSQILDLQENELDWLTRHLGHDIQVHRQYYRLHDSTIELAKVSKILTTVDQGKTGQWAGKSLDEIDIDMDIEPIEGKL